MDDARTISLLEKFMNELDVEGICGFWIDEERDDHDSLWVYIILDIDWINKVPTKPQFVANRMRNGVKEEIKKFLGLDVMVGSTAKKCNEIKESKKDYVISEKQLSILLNFLGN